MRNLTDKELDILQAQRCWAEDWGKVVVADGFDARNVRNVNFYGEIEIGKGCRLIDIRMIKGSGKKMGAPLISVLNESGVGNIVLCKQLTAQLAWMMMRYTPLLEMAKKEAGDGGKTIIGDGAIIESATKILDCVINSSEKAPTYIGPEVIMEKSVTACGAEVTDGSKVYESFIGEAVHIGKGFSSQASCFFANSYMDNGEACAALCGPFSCSHHKSTLLIGGEFSFYNAGSNTNQSNHAYKMGPIHWGVLERGAKTASGCHILWPATIGAFSMVMGKISQHPNLSNLPFSYIFGNGANTYIYPGTNIKTVGTWRDISKWPTRDRRNTDRDLKISDLITFDFLNPYLLQVVKRGITALEDILNSQGEKEEYIYQNCIIKKTAIEKGLQYYRLILSLSGEDKLCKVDGEYVDMLGFVTRIGEVEKVLKKIENGSIKTLGDVQLEISKAKMGSYNIDTKSEAYKQWVLMIERDARKEFDMGDVSEEQLLDFLKGMK